MPTTEEIVEAQLTSLDDTDCYASVWNDILVQQREGRTSSSLWGGRGKGGRGLARRTVQPRDIVVDDVRLQYLLGDVCLEGATIKLLQKHVYALVGKNGCGKSTLLQRMHAQKIPGWSSQWTSLYIPPELPNSFQSMSPLSVILKYQEQTFQYSSVATQSRIDELDEKLGALNIEEEQEEVERLCEELANLEEQLNSDHSTIEQQAKEALAIMDVENVPACADLSLGQQKRLLISVAIVCSYTNLLLLDEPTNHLDVLGLIQLRQLIESSAATVVMVSHDVDLVNDVATDIIDMEAQKLHYFPGNYDSYRLMKDQKGMHVLRQSAAMQKKRDHLKNKLQHLKEKPPPRRGGAKKKAKAVASQRKKLDRHVALEKQIHEKSVLPVRKGLTSVQRLKLAESMKTIPDKAIQFEFRKTTCTWNEPLITALEIGHGFDEDAMRANTEISGENDGEFRIVKKAGYLFDCVDLCIEEGSRNCILGPTASGKSTLLQILAKQKSPVEGTVYHASGVRVGYFDLQRVSRIISSMDESTTALQYLTAQYPKKTEQDLRGQLTAFGLSPINQAKTSVCHLSSGEKCRFVLAAIMMDDPPILCLDDPTSHLDVGSVQALIYGLRQWNGTLVMVSQDANFLRSLEDVKCVVIMPEEGKVRRLEGGIDAYLKSFRL